MHPIEAPSARPCNRMKQGLARPMSASPDCGRHARPCTSSRKPRPPVHLISHRAPSSAPHHADRASNRSITPLPPSRDTSQPATLLRLEAPSLKACSPLHLIRQRVFVFGAGSQNPGGLAHCRLPQELLSDLVQLPGKDSQTIASQVMTPPDTDGKLPYCVNSDEPSQSCEFRAELNRVTESSTQHPPP